MATAFTHINGQNFISTLHRSNHRRPSGGPIRVTMAQKSSYWNSINDDIDAHLRRVITIREPFSVFKPMHHLTFAAPETTAPALCIAACELFGGRRELAIAAASALHLMHAASYFHEHIPLTDQTRPNSPPRPGPTFGPNIELLTGDGMIPFGLELLAKSNNLDDDDEHSDRILQVIIELTRAIGSQGVVNGQYIQAQCDESNPSVGKAGSTRIVTDKKGSELHACGAACGAILGGGKEKEIEKLRKYGFYAGTIQKMSKLKEVEKNREVIEEMRRLALKELEYFDEEKVEPISSFINV